VDEDKDAKIIPQRILCKNPDVTRSPLTNGRTKSQLCTRQPGATACFGMRSLLNQSLFSSATGVSKGNLLKLTRLKWDEFLKANDKDEKLKKRILHALGFEMENALQGLGFLRGIEVEKLQLMAQCFRFLILEKDAPLFKRGEMGGREGNGLHYLLEGQVKVIVFDESEKVEKVVAVVNKKQFFGEVGLVVHLPRTASVIARKKCLFLELQQSDFRRFVGIAPEVLESFKEKLEDYNIPLRYLIHNPILQKFLVQYLESEFSAENIKFWIKAKDFRLNSKARSDDADDVRNEGQEIFDEFISSSASTQVNIIGNTQKEIQNALKSPQPITRELFQKAEEDVLALMSRDTFARFKSSPKFQECLKTMTSADNYKPSDKPDELKMVDTKAKGPVKDLKDTSNDF